MFVGPGSECRVELYKSEARMLKYVLRPLGRALLRGPCTPTARVIDHDATTQSWLVLGLRAELPVPSRACLGQSGATGAILGKRSRTTRTGGESVLGGWDSWGVGLAVGGWAVGEL